MTDKTSEEVKFLLTDDEVVAIAIQGGVDWPHPLATVISNTDEMLKAGGRGARSLLVRGLASVDSSKLVIDETLQAAFVAACESKMLFSGHLARAATPSELVGSSSFLFLGDEPKLSSYIDLVSANGVHDFFSLSKVDAIATFLALAENSFKFGFQNAVDSDEVILLLSSNRRLNSAQIAKGMVTLGELDMAKNVSSFSAAESFNTWDGQKIASHIGLDTTFS